jgi:hypothetical protein
MSARADVDRSALLCALVLAPATFARNRFFTLFTDSSARRTRARAAQLRTIVRHLAHDNPRAEVTELTLREDGAFLLRYGIRRLKLKRTSVLDRLELSLVRFAISRRTRPGSEPLAAPLQVTTEDRGLVYATIAKLAEKLVLPPALDEKSAPSTGEAYHPATTSGDS